MIHVGLLFYLKEKKKKAYSPFLRDLNLCHCTRHEILLFKCLCCFFLFSLLLLISSQKDRNIDLSVRLSVLFVVYLFYLRILSQTLLSFSLLVSKCLTSLILYSKFCSGENYSCLIQLLTQEILVLGSVDLHECVVGPALVSFFSAFSINLEKTDIDQILLRVSHK